MRSKFRGKSIAKRNGITIGNPVEDDIYRILQFHDSFPPSVESYRYQDDASFMGSTATRTSYLLAPDWLFMTRSTEGFLLRSKVYI